MRLWEDGTLLVTFGPEQHPVRLDLRPFSSSRSVSSPPLKFQLDYRFGEADVWLDNMLTVEFNEQFELTDIRSEG